MSQYLYRILTMQMEVNSRGKKRIYERLYVRLYVWLYLWELYGLPNTDVRSSVLPNLYVRSYVLPNLNVENPAYGRKSISWPMRIVAPIPKESC